MAKILLIEPDRLLAKQYWRALEAAGHEVIICLNGHDAIFAADEHSPELVIMELQLKKHNGIEFLYEFRSYVEWQTVPVIVLSHVPPSAIDGATARPLLGINRYYYKPKTGLAKLVQAAGELTQIKVS